MGKGFARWVFAGVSLGALGLGALAAAGATTDSKGLDVAGMDRAVKPGDDFYAYANGGWMQSTPMPADRPAIGAFSTIEEEVTQRTADLIREAGRSGATRDSEARKVGYFFNAFMDEKAIEARGLTPVKEELGAVAAIQDHRALAHLLGSQLRADVDPLNNTEFHTDRLLGLWVSPDFAHPDRNVGYLLQGGLGMPDRDNYRNSDARDQELQAKYRAHIARMLELAGMTGAAARAGRIYDLERAIADAHVSRTDSEDVHKANNPWKLSEFAARAPGLDWDAFFGAAGLGREPMIMVWQPSAVTGIAALAGSRPLEDWKDYLAFHAVDRAAPLLPKALA